jgi:YVTN family beta-propeller protein
MRRSVQAVLCLTIGVAACGGNKNTNNPPDATVAIDGAPMADACACATTATGSTHGSAIAITPDDSTIVSVNKDVGTVTVARADYSAADGQPVLSKVAELDVGGTRCEPWEVTIDACGKCAYVVDRQAQKVVRIENLKTVPTVGPSADTGSEPTSIAISPNNTSLYVANWVDGTLSVINPQTMSAGTVIDLNAALVATGTLGAGVTARPGLAHPRDLAITNNGNPNDSDETIVVTEFFAQRVQPEVAGGAQADVSFAGLVYKVPAAGGAIETIQLPAVADTGFHDHNDAVTGCFPNMLGAVTLDGTNAWVASTCASPKGPLGVFQKTFVAPAKCVVNTDCAALGGSCNVAAGTCAPNSTDVKTTTHPAMSVVDLATNVATTTVLDKGFDLASSARLPLLPSDIAFKANLAYVTAAGTDAAFQLTTAAGAITAYGSATNKFIDLRKSAADSEIRMPQGIAMANAAGHAYAFVNNQGTRDITAMSLTRQAIAGDQASDFRILQASAMPATGSAEAKVLRGKRFFTTGLGRWSLSGQGWGSCAACHFDGLSDNVSWYFPRGPRQSTSLDGSFAKNNPADQRLFNWSATADEIADFDINNVRPVSGGVGALVTANSTPPATSDRIDTAAISPPQQGLQGANDEIATPTGTSAHPHTILNDWVEIKAYVQSIRSPRAAKGFPAADITAGAALFAASAGNCVGCHSGPKWTISTRFYTPGDAPTAATTDPAPTSLANISWNANLNGFPAALFPVDATNIGSAFMRIGAGATEVMQCELRPVGTFGISDPTIAVQELRQDMVTAGLGIAGNERGFNPPSLLGLQVGGPFFHGGNARTLEEVFNARFSGHHQSAIAPAFTLDATKIRQLVAFLMSIDESSTPIAIPALGATGGDLCHYP